MSNPWSAPVFLKVAVGPMTTGKTSLLIHELERASNIHGGKSLCVTHSLDEKRAAVIKPSGAFESCGEIGHVSTPYDDECVDDGIVACSSHSETTRIAARAIFTIRLSTLAGGGDRINGILKSRWDGNDRIAAVGFDEAQFFDGEDLVSTIKVLLSSSFHPAVIIVVGLDGDIHQRPFPGSGIHNLIPISDEFTKLTSAVCKRCIACGNGPNCAPFTIKHTSSSSSDSGNIIEIGGTEMYEAVCRKHLI